MKLDFKATRWNCGKYQVEGVGDGFYWFLIFGEPYMKNVGGVRGSSYEGLYRTKEQAMDAAQRYDDEELHKTMVQALDAL